MKKKNKKGLVIVISILILVVITIICLFKFDFNNNNTLTLEESKWIDENKYDVIDIAIMNDIPVLSYDGEGLVYDYLDYITENYSLKFNVISYKLDGTLDYDYTLDIVDKVSKNDIELLKDSLVLLTPNKIQYNDISEISNLRIGVLKSDKSLVENYLNNTSLTYVEYDTYNDLKNSIINSKIAIEEGNQGDVDAIIVLKMSSTKELIENNLNVAYHFNDLNKHFVISTKGNEKLNSILKKCFNSWKLNNYETKYNEFLLSDYYYFKKLSDVDQKTLKSKSYVFGFVDHGIYNYLDGKKINGLNGVVLKGFNKFSGLSITYTQYNSIAKLVKDFNNNKVDFTFDLINNDRFEKNIYETIDVLDKKLVVISDINSNITIDNLKSLEGKEILTIKNSYIEKFLIDNNIKFKSYNNMDDMVSDFKSGDISIIDLENYNFYSKTHLKNARISYMLDIMDDYNFIINDIDENKLFEDIFNFYLSFNSMNKLTTQAYEQVAHQNLNIVFILLIIIAILVLYVVLDFNNHIKVMIKTIKKNKKVNLSKEEKIM